MLTNDAAMTPAQAARAAQRAQLRRRVPAGMGVYAVGLVVACALVWWVSQ